MDLDEYQRRAKTTDRIVGGWIGIAFTVFSLQEELGSLSQRFKKRIRDGQAYTDFQDAVSRKIGDILWYLAILADRLGLSLEEIAERNLTTSKLRWGQKLPDASLFRGVSYDANFPPDQRFPRHMRFRFEEKTENGLPRVSLFHEGTGLDAPLKQADDTVQSNVRPQSTQIGSTIDDNSTVLEADPKRLCNNQLSLFRVLADFMVEPCVGRTAAVAGRGCVISAAAILSCLRRQRGVTSWPGLKSRGASISAMGSAMQATPPRRSGP